METFPMMRRKDEAKYREYRTKRVTLEPPSPRYGTYCFFFFQIVSSKVFGTTWSRME
jgi:hypothetical protein